MSYQETLSTEDRIEIAQRALSLFCVDLHNDRDVKKAIHRSGFGLSEIGWDNLGRAIERERRRRSGSFTGLSGAVDTAVARIWSDTTVIIGEEKSNGTG